MARSLDRAEYSHFVACILGAILYGVFFVLALTCTHILTRTLLKRPSSRRTHVFLLTCTILMFILATTRVTLDTTRTAIALLDIPAGAERQHFLTSVTGGLYAALNADYGMMVWVGDTVVIWRAAALWSDFRVVIPSIVMALGSFVCQTVAIYRMQHTSAATVVYMKSIQQWAQGFAALSLSANLLATILIAYKLYTISSHPSLSPSTTLRRTGIIMLESGMLNAAMLLTYEISLATHSNLFHIIAVAEIYVVGITFAVIIIRVGLHGSSAKEFEKSMITLGDRVVFSARGDSSTIERGRTMDRHLESFDWEKTRECVEMRPIEVTVTKFLERDDTPSQASSS